MALNLAEVKRSSHGTWIVTLNNARVDEDTSKVRAQAVADFLNRGRANGFPWTTVSFVTKFGESKPETHMVGGRP
jgi:hypothetical protein